jgi:ABC-type nitrate/sulfonate/bicarbonate transport system substrate-binding protein
MKRTGIVIALMAAALLALAGCTPATTSSNSGSAGTASSTTTSSVAATGNSTVRPSKMVNQDKMYLMVTKTYDASKYPKDAMTGEPSTISFFKPTKDEGILNRDYPTYDKKTFKFLSLPASMIAPQDYYLFQKNGGTLNTALKGTGYKATEILDSGHIKILPNLYLGYYDFAWVPLNVMTEYWSGNESMNQELWRDGNDYVIIGAAWDGGTSLLAPSTVTDVKQLANKTVGIMNPSFNLEALFNKKLESVSMATKSAGGTVGIEMASPGFVMNDLMAMKNSAVFAWGQYAGALKAKGYHELVNWTQMGYGTKVPYQVLVVRRDILEKHPEIVQKVVQLNYDATQKALKSTDWLKANTTRYQYYMSHYFGTAANPAAANLIHIDAQASPTFLKDVISYMTKCNYFKTPYTYSQLVDQSFYDKVKK